jgi:hypothetical protein
MHAPAGCAGAKSSLPAKSPLPLRERESSIGKIDWLCRCNHDQQGFQETLGVVAIIEGLRYLIVPLSQCDKAK